MRHKRRKIPKTGHTFVYSFHKQRRKGELAVFLFLFIVIVVVMLVAALVVGKVQISQGNDNTFCAGFYDGFIRALLNKLSGGK